MVWKFQGRRYCAGVELLVHISSALITYFGTCYFSVLGDSLLDDAYLLSSRNSNRQVPTVAQLPPEVKDLRYLISIRYCGDVHAVQQRYQSELKLWSAMGKDA